MQFSKQPLELRGYGKAVPSYGLVESKLFDGALDLPEGTVFKETGVLERYVGTPEEGPAQLLARAVHHALTRAHIDATEVDLVLLAKSTCGASKAFSIDELAVEMGLPVGVPVTGMVSSGAPASALLQMAGSLLTANPGLRNIAILACDPLKEGVGLTNWRHAAASGEGAAAFIVSPARSGGYGHLLSMGSSVGQRSPCQGLPAAGAPVATSQGLAGALEQRMKLSQAVSPEVLTRVLATVTEEYPQLTGDLLVVPNQASVKALTALRDCFEPAGLPVHDIFPHYGNQGAASSLFALAHLLDEGQLGGRQHVLLVEHAAGPVSGATLLYIPRNSANKPDHEPA